MAQRKKKKHQVLYKAEAKKAQAREIAFLRMILKWALDNVTAEARGSERYAQAVEVAEGRNPNKESGEYGWF